MRGRDRITVAAEAARLVYFHQAIDFKQAKEKAAKDLRLKVLPTNFEVAIQLDKIASEIEGSSRVMLILAYRTEALDVMKRLQAFHPRLLGSVWRGTAMNGSDIDIEAFCDDPGRVIKVLEEKYHNLRIERTIKTNKGVSDHFLHVYFELPSKSEVEIVIKGLERRRERRKCEVYGDDIVGLNIPQLEDTLKEDPWKRFVPKER